MKPSSKSTTFDHGDRLKLIGASSRAKEITEKLLMEGNNKGMTKVDHPSPENLGLRKEADLSGQPGLDSVTSGEEEGWAAGQFSRRL